MFDEFFLRIPVVFAVVAGLIGLRFVGARMLTWAVAWWLAIYIILEYGFATPIPGSVITIYMSIVTGSILAYASSSADRWNETVRPILRLVLEPKLRPVLLLALLAIPTLAAVNVWAKMNVALEAPSFPRTIHPAPPDSIVVHENDVDLIAGENPYRELETSDPEAFAKHLENGRRVYFENCFYCHGDSMGGDGMFAYGLNPIPTNFNDQGILPQFQESFLFWRIAKGGPGLPDEGGPWDSAMPAWEKFLTEEEMWDVLAYMYEFNDYRPREREVHH